MGFVREEEEAVGEEQNHDSDDSDDDVDRYVFLARQPASAQASSDGDGDGEGAAVVDGGGGGGRGRGRGRGRKRFLRELLQATASPSAAGKARVDEHLTITGSKTAESSLNAVRLLDRGKIENKKSGRCGGGKALVPRTVGGKRSRVPDGEASGEGSHRDVHARTAAAVAEASRRFLCNLCGRCFGSHHALGGHVRVHRNREKHDIAGASHEEKTAAVVAGNINREGFRGNGDSESEDGVIAAASHERTIVNGRDEEEMGIGAGNAEEECTDGDGTEKKIAVRRCHKLATGGSGNKIARKTGHRCEACGKECLTGQALGGHMRKHRAPPG